jgi:hypothetical protein
MRIIYEEAESIYSLVDVSATYVYGTWFRVGVL